MSQVSWLNEDPKITRNDLTKKLGPAQVLAKEMRGIAIWYGNEISNKDIGYGQNCFNEIWIRDESITHMCPHKHTDYVYCFVKIPIHPPSKLADVLSISGSVNYDALKQLLSARCGSIEANIATLKLATDLIIGEEVTVKLPNNETLKYKTIMDVHGIGAYGKMIMSTMDKNFTKQIYDSLCENIKKILERDGKYMDMGYWPGAFGENCGAPDKSNLICHDKWDKADKPHKTEKSEEMKKSKGWFSSLFGSEQKGGFSERSDKINLDNLFEGGGYDISDTKNAFGTRFF